MADTADLISAAERTIKSGEDAPGDGLGLYMKAQAQATLALVSAIQTLGQDILATRSPADALEHLRQIAIGLERK